MSERFMAQLNCLFYIVERDIDYDFLARSRILELEKEIAICQQEDPYYMNKRFFEDFSRRLEVIKSKGITLKILPNK